MADQSSHRRPADRVSSVGRSLGPNCAPAGSVLERVDIHFVQMNALTR